jgi:hypothetical protein
MSLPRRLRVFSLRRIAAIFLAGGLFAAGTQAQYTGRIAKTDDKKPVLRSVAVLEWTGAPGKPSATRLVPVAVYDGEQLNDGTIYLPEPYPLAVSNGIEYELQMAGKPIGLFDLMGVGKEDGEWEGFGAWKPLTVPEAKKAENAFNSSSLNNGGFGDDDDKPVLKRKHPKEADSDDSSGSAKPAASSGSGGSASGSSSDPDRPTLHRKTGDDSGSSGSSTAGGTGSADPDRPTLHRSRRTEDADTGAGTATPDPDRPRLKHGKPAGLEDAETPLLKGFPPSMQQAVAVSDAYDHAEHPWKYSWANPDDEQKMKEALEAMARTALGLNPSQDKPAASPAKTVKTATARKKTPLVPSAPPAPAPLVDEQFRVFELAYGSSATMVLTASTAAPPGSTDATSSTAQADDSNEPPPPVIKRGKPTSSQAASTAPANTATAKTSAASKPAPQRFVTLVAQPDLYGGIAVLYKSVTDSAHLDDKPRMRLIDAVDAMADNRGELLFELRGNTERQFALFRVLRGSAEQLFATIALQ